LTERQGFGGLVSHGLFDRSRPPHPLAARCGTIVRRPFLVTNRPFARSFIRAEMPGFFALAAVAWGLRAA
jgi:hypothetical protein